VPKVYICAQLKQQIFTKNVQIYQNGSENLGRLLTPDEAAEHLGVCKKTVLRRIYDGSIKAAKLGHRTYRIEEGDLQKYLEENKTQKEA